MARDPQQLDDEEMIVLLGQAGVATDPDVATRRNRVRTFMAVSLVAIWVLAGLVLLVVVASAL